MVASRYIETQLWNKGICKYLFCSILKMNVRLFATLWTIQSMEFSRQEYWSGYPFPSPGDLPNLGIEPRSPTLQADSLLAEPPGKPKNTGVGSLFLLQRVFLTQESNWGLLHCRQILCQLRNTGSPKINNHYVLFIFGNMEGRSNLVSEGSNQINTKREREHLRWEGALAYSHSPFESHSVIFGPQTIPEGAWGKIFIICIKDEENEA